MADSDREHDQGEELDAAAVQLVLKETKDLIRSLEGTRIARVKVRAGALEIEIERRPGTAAVGSTAPNITAAPAPPPESGMPILAPLVGVFYRAASPGAKPFVAVGDAVERGQKVGIVEAMKVMNEVTSDYKGRVVEILVENGTPVQFEQRLMLIDTGGQ